MADRNEIQRTSQQELIKAWEEATRKGQQGGAKK